MAPQQKGKQGTKGAKQIVEENATTLKFYRNMAMGSTAVFVILNSILFDLSGFSVLMTILSTGSLAAAYQFMAFMCKSKTTDTGAILDSGSDLNMADGIAEHVKDLIILTSLTQILSLLSNWFWFLLLLTPLRAIWLLWGSVIKPWLSQKNEQPEIDEKKQAKLERRARRMK